MMSGNKQQRASTPLRIIGSLLSLLVILFGGALIGFTSCMLVSFEYIGEIFGRYVFFSGIYTILTCGIFTALIGVISFYSFTHSNRFTAIIACVGLIFFSIVISCTSLIVYIYPKIMTDLIYDRMVKTFPNYGQNMQVTNAWDTIQNNLRCCAIHNRGWADYNKTVWYKLTNADIHQHGKLIPRTNLYYNLVPVSCCSTIIDGLTGFPLQIYRNTKRCQNWQYGPPTFLDGPHNDAIYYRGCYSLFVDYINVYVEYILGMGLASVSLLIITLILLLYAELLTVPSSLQKYNPNLPRDIYVK
ncbi:tetraspanin family protein [Schistosoma japonicum]|nr:tetraspanin family protein [Schistosoma japonicum]